MYGIVYLNYVTQIHETKKNMLVCNLGYPGFILNIKARLLSLVTLLFLQKKILSKTAILHVCVYIPKTLRITLERNVMVALILNWKVIWNVHRQIQTCWHRHHTISRAKLYAKTCRLESNFLKSKFGSQTVVAILIQGYISQIHWGS